jgi:hypothetical protein
LHPYGVLTGNPTNSWVIESELVGGASARGALRYEPSIHFRVGGEYIQYARDAAPVFTGPGRQAQWSVAGFLRPGRDQGYFFLDGRVDQIRTATGALTRSRLGASIQTSAMRLLPYARTEGRREFVGVATFIMPRPQWGQVLSQVLLRTTTEVERLGGVVSWSAFAARPVAPGLRLEVGANWQRGVAGATYTVNLTTYVAAVRAVTFMVAPPGEPVSGTQYLQGSVLWDRRTGRLGVAPGPALQRAGLAGRVFLDKNANGIRDPDEPGISQAHVLIGSRTAATDADGLYHVWDLVPFEPVMVSIDSLSLDSPLLVPLFTRTSIVPGPNRYRTLDIPLIEAGVIEGRVTRSGAGVGGVTLILFDRGRNVRRTLTTFSDGGFYLMGVKPGDYELFVPVNVLDALGADALPVRFTLKSTAGGVGRSDLEVQLKPRF